MKYNPYNYLGLEVIKGVLDLVYTEKVREDKGGTYGVSVSLSEEKRPEELAEGMITFDCDPARANELKNIIYQELSDRIQGKFVLLFIKSWHGRVSSRSCEGNRKPGGHCV